MKVRISARLGWRTETVQWHHTEQPSPGPADRGSSIRREAFLAKFLTATKGNLEPGDSTVYTKAFTVRSQPGWPTAEKPLHTSSITEPPGCRERWRPRWRAW